VLLLTLQASGECHGKPYQVGLDTGVAQLLAALGRFCDAEGLAASDLHLLAPA